MNVSFSKLGKMGRLGNQLFQVATVIVTAAKNKGIAIFPKWTYQFAFVNELNTGEFPENEYKEPNFHYEEIHITQDTDLLGYFQSAKYFKGYENLIKSQFTFKGNFKEECKVGIEQAFEKGTIAIHIRRGDYLQEPYKNLYYQLPITWFINALLSIDNWQGKNVILFSDDIEYCKFHFSCLPNVYFSEGKSDIQDLCLVSQCDEQIISNSTFAWWGAYLGKQKNVIHSGKLFAGEFLNKDISDFYPENWNEFWPETTTLNLADTTFTLPVFYDHKDRKQNLDLCVCVLQSCFNTNIIIGEQGSSKFEYHSQWAKYIKFPYQKFHRTKMLNEMAKQSNTTYVANWDCDVMIAPLQVYMSVVELRNGSDMVFPYDGRFARLPRDPWFKRLERSIDLGALKDAPVEGKGGRKVPVSSVGGAVMFNKESFIEGGMENEYMISFGPEDCERNDRFTKMGYKITRMSGPLFHIDHFCGPDSSTKNPFFRSNHVELEKGRKMTKEQLINYVDSWPWAKNIRNEFEAELKSLSDINYKIKAVVTIGSEEKILYDDEVSDAISMYFKMKFISNSVKTVLHVKK